MSTFFYDFFNNRTADELSLISNAATEWIELHSVI